MQLCCEEPYTQPWGPGGNAIRCRWVKHRGSKPLEMVQERTGPWRPDRGDATSIFGFRINGRNSSKSVEIHHNQLEKQLKQPKHPNDLCSFNENSQDPLSTLAWKFFFSCFTALFGLVGEPTYQWHPIAMGPSRSKIHH